MPEDRYRGEHRILNTVTCHHGVRPGLHCEHCQALRDEIYGDGDRAVATLLLNERTKMPDAHPETVRLQCLSPWCSSHGNGGSVPFCPLCWSHVPDENKAKVVLAHDEALRSGCQGVPFHSDAQAHFEVTMAAAATGLIQGRYTPQQVAAMVALGRSKAWELQEQAEAAAQQTASEGDAAAEAEVESEEEPEKDGQSEGVTDRPPG